MAQRAKHHILLAQQMADAPAHGVEGLQRLTNIARTLNRHFLRFTGSADFLRGGGQILQRPRHPTGDPERCCKHEREDDEGAGAKEENLVAGCFRRDRGAGQPASIRDLESQYYLTRLARRPHCAGARWRPGVWPKIIIGRRL